MRLTQFLPDQTLPHRHPACHGTGLLHSFQDVPPIQLYNPGCNLKWFLCLIHLQQRGCSHMIVAQWSLPEINMQHVWLHNILTVSIFLAYPLWNHPVSHPWSRYLWAKRNPKNPINQRFSVQDWTGMRSARSLNRNPRKNLRPPGHLTKTPGHSK